MLFVINWLGYNTSNDHITPIAYASFVIPLVGIYIAVSRYKIKEKENAIGFFEALFQSFKILLISGLVAGSLGIAYISYLATQINLFYFSGRLFGALLVGILICLGVSVTLTNKSSKLD